MNAENINTTAGFKNIPTIQINFKQKNYSKNTNHDRMLKMMLQNLEIPLIYLSIN